MKKKAFSELVIGIACTLLGIAVYIMAGDLQKVRLGIGPAGFPRFIAVVLAVLGIAQTVTTLKSGVASPQVQVDKKAAGLFAAAVVMCVVYVMLVSTVGFVLMTPLLLIGMMYLFGERSIKTMLIISVVTTVCVWLLFTEVFMIFLPTGRLF
ncbi:MAG: tripartite tricarboxylate transporter TctB family protein [Clostridia bacterium]|nr:tripartite tricarboxylate transporter TctB family protein [Clostridia bacterium]